ncbi:hypothetical protein SLG_23430 [Sphingobium sp. SYK-6]|nr:hypothetical protein SLG_23430 [Sphingobium sp. SYK-6]
MFARHIPSPRRPSRRRARAIAAPCHGFAKQRLPAAKAAPIGLACLAGADTRTARSGSSSAW